MPRTRTWRCSSSQLNTADAAPSASSWRLLTLVVVGEEREAALVGAAHEHDPGVGRAVGVDRAERHRVRFGHAHFERVGVPPLPLHHRVAVEVVDVEPGRLVLHPPIADHVAIRPSIAGRVIRHAGPIASMPRMYGRSTAGTTIEPSAWRWFSTIAAHTRGTASAEPLSVCTSSRALLARRRR